MQRVNIVCFGKLKETFWRDAVNEYAKRLSAYCKFTVTEISEEPLSQKPSQKEIEQALDAEAALAMKYISDRSYVFALCVEGTQMTSEALSQKLADIGVKGEGDVVFLIGSSYGMSQKLKQRADCRISFSKMTFPHQLVRVILSEQIYRAYTIMHRTKYHK